MFTGIIEATGTILERNDASLAVERPSSFDDVQRGSSICVSGVCLTVVDLDERTMRFDVIPETEERTTLGSLQAGDRVNLERALPAAGRIEGHIVQGHVEATGTVANSKCSSSPSLGAEGQMPNSNGNVLTIAIPATLLPCVIPKGSIAVDGVSLTVASVAGDRVSLAIIPHTLKVTTLGLLREGDRVNIETDLLVRCARSSPSSP